MEGKENEQERETAAEDKEDDEMSGDVCKKRSREEEESESDEGEGCDDDVMSKTGILDLGGDGGSSDDEPSPESHTRMFLGLVPIKKKPRKKTKAECCLRLRHHAWMKPSALSPPPLARRRRS